MNHRTKLFFEDLYWMAFAIVLLLLAISLAQVVSAL